MLKLRYFGSPLLLLLALSCKPVGEGGSSDLMSTKADHALPTSLKEATITVTPPADVPEETKDAEGFDWKVHAYWKAELGKVKQLAGHFFVDTTSIFFSTKNDPRTTKEVEDKYEKSQLVDLEKVTLAVIKGDTTPIAGVAAKLAKLGPKGNPIDTDAEVKTFKQKVKEFTLKEKMRVTTNFHVNSKDLLVSANWYTDGFILGKKMCGSCGHSVNFIAKAGIDKSETDTTVKGVALVTFHVLSNQVLNKSIETKVIPYSHTQTIFDTSIPVYGFPYLQIVVKLGLTMTGAIDYGMSVRMPGSLTLTVVPNIQMNAYVGPGAEIGPLTASIHANLMIFKLGWPISATVGGKWALKFFYGGLTYDGQEFDALKGAVLACVKVEIPILFKAILFSVNMLLSKYHLNIPKPDWKWEHEIWAPKNALVSKKATGYAGPSFKYVSAANCKAAKTLMLAHAAKMKASSAAGASTEGKPDVAEMKTSFDKMMAKIEKKIGC